MTRHDRALRYYRENRALEPGTTRLKKYTRLMDLSDGTLYLIGKNGAVRVRKDGVEVSLTDPFYKDIALWEKAKGYSS